VAGSDSQENRRSVLRGGASLDALGVVVVLAVVAGLVWVVFLG